MQTSVSPLRVKVPCDDEREFYARIADRIATNGLRVAIDELRPIGSRVAVALEFRNGRTLSGEGVIDAHVQLDAARSGVNVRLLKLERPDEEPAAARPTPPPPAARRPPSPPREPPEVEVEVEAEPTGSRSAALEEALFDDAAQAAEAPPVDPQAFTGSAEIIAQVRHRTVRAQRVAAGFAAAALVIAVAGYSAFRLSGGPATPEQAAAAHLEAADRLMHAGRLTGANGALEHLLAARQLSPADPETDARLRRAADVLESLGTRALERGDPAVASIHLAGAKLADPARPSIRAKLEKVERLRSPRSPR